MARRENEIRSEFAEHWLRVKPRLLERCAVLERASADMGGAVRDEDLAQAAGVQAHQLAGLLGTFGLDVGTKLARGLETRLAAGPGGAGAGECAGLAAELRAAIEQAQIEPSEQSPG